MTKRSKTGFGLLLLLLFLLALGVAGEKVYQDGQRQKLNRALIAAVKENDLATVRARLAAGADVNARDLPLDTRSLWWQLWDRVCGKPLRTEGDIPTALMVAMKREEGNEVPSDRVPLVTALLDAGAEVNARDARGATALFYAADSGSLPLVQTLLARGALVNIRNYAERTPLHGTACDGKADLARLLIEKGSDVNAVDNAGDTPLFDAVLYNEAECVELLLARGAQMNIKDKGEFTPLMFAQENRNVPIIAMLKKAGAKDEECAPAQDSR